MGSFLRLSKSDAGNKGDGDEHADSNLAVPAVITSTAGHWYFCSEQLEVPRTLCVRPAQSAVPTRLGLQIATRLLCRFNTRVPSFLSVLQKLVGGRLALSVS